ERFAATHYAGSQKLPASQVDALRKVNPDFVVLQYRLGLGLGYRATSGGCTPNGDWIRILDGDRWIREWPARVQERWFVHRAGSWVTTRDTTDYSGADGIMLEGFATGLAPVDWALELDRALGLIRKGRVVIAQSYPDAADVDARTFDLASYLLIKGDRTYVNL